MRRWVLTYPYPPSSSSGRPSRRVLPQARHPFRRQTASSPTTRSDERRRRGGLSQDLSINPFPSLSFLHFPSFFHTPPSSPLDLRDRAVEYLSAGERANPRQERCPSEANPAKNNPGPTRCPARSFASSPVRPPSPSHAP